MLQVTKIFNKNVNDVCDTDFVSGTRFSFHYDEAGPGCFPAIVIETTHCDGTSGPAPSSVPVNHSGYQAAMSLSNLWAQVAQEIQVICQPDACESE